MQGWRNLIRQSFCVGFLGMAVWLGAPAGAAAQSCTTQNGVYTCTISSGNYSSPISISASISNDDAAPMLVTAEGDMNVSVSSSVNFALAFSSGSSSSHFGASAASLTVDNTGSINLTPGQNSPTSEVYGLSAKEFGRALQNLGGTQVTVTNSGAITINLLATQMPDWGGAIYALGQGGYGGGSSNGAAVTNSGTIDVSATGPLGYTGIVAFGYGGDGVYGDEGQGSSGGYAASSYVTNSGPVTVNWTWQPSSSDYGLYGILAQAVGGAGGDTDDDGSANGASGGSAGYPSVTLTKGGDVTVNAAGEPPTPTSSLPLTPSAGVSAASVGGNGGTGSGDQYSSGGDGGNTDGPQIFVTDANVETSGDDLPGLVVFAQGGSGGQGGCVNGSPGSSSCDFSNSYSYENGGNGGSVSAANDTISVTAATEGVTISTAGGHSAAIEALYEGGAGGAGGDDVAAFSGTGGGNGGAGGNTGPIDIVLSGSGAAPIVNVRTTGGNSPGVYAASLGGAGGDGGWYDATWSAANGGNGGNGGTGGDITVSLSSTTLSTQGALSPGILADSEGGVGGNGNVASTGRATGGTGGAGGAAGAVSVTLDSASGINTYGPDSSGIVAQSLSAAGGGGSDADGKYSSVGGNGGAGGNAGNVNVTVSNNAAISTEGTTSRGILAQSLSGAGGSGGSASGFFYAAGGTGASSGTAGTISVTNDGQIRTSGPDSEGILAQSIGGSGGAGGQSYGVVAGVGGNASTNPLTSDGGTAAVFNGGLIETSGISAIGMLGQSIGGGGGDGGGASAVAVSIGGNGGVGGSGGSVQGGLSTGSQTITSGDEAPAVVLQSIGGGGGNGGNASSLGLFASVAIGGNGSGGNSGGSVSLNSYDATVSTAGSKSPGLVAQSIGGGGGTGGAAFSGTVSAGFSAAVAVGGTGSGGGNGGPVEATLVGSSIATGQNSLLVNGTNSNRGDCSSLPCNTLPVDDYGVEIQSIGGGGGAGGSASALALALEVPVPETDAQIAVSAAAAVGGNAGGGGNGGTVDFSLSQGSTITTMGQGSDGVLIQSVGGGGGAGGDSSANSMAVGYGDATEGTSLSVTTEGTVGGTGGGGGYGGPVNIAIGGTISNGTFSPDQPNSAPTSIVTYGDFADGIVAQSIGGGGGNAGYGSGNTQQFGVSENTSVGINLGATGASGGNGDAVQIYLYPGKGITTFGSGAVGILAQSIGGGGGASQGSGFTLGQSVGPVTPTVKLALGTQGASGGYGGAVTVFQEAPITTHGGDATGILAQSVGGGGGLAGGAGSDASADNPIVAALQARDAASNFGSFLNGDSDINVTATLSLAIGGMGGTGGNGWPVTVNVAAPITTTGDWADGVVAQSIGGGGGKGGNAVATGTGGLSNVTINGDIAVGGTGGSGGDGGTALVNLNQGSSSYSIQTAGFGATGVIAQSIGGGGGIGANGSDSATGTYSVGGGSGGSGGTGGNGGSASVVYNTPNTASIATAGAAANGVDVQSIGGGGGIAGAGSHLFGAAWKQSGSLTLSAGGGTGASGNGGTATFGPQNNDDTPLHITTTGNDSYGILAQSIGGGGGIVTGQPSSSSAPNIKIGGPWNGIHNSSSGNGSSVTVTLSSRSTITTSGIGAHGIVAQSIGAGGGVIRIVNATGDTPMLTTELPAQYGANGVAATGTGGAVSVEADGDISVTGAGAIGILAQSIGGGGGLITADNNIYAGSSNLGQFCSSCSYAAGGNVTVTTNGPISATGANGIGIFAQSTGYGPSGQVNITVNNGVTGGSGTAATSNQPGSSAIQIDSPAGGPTNQVTVNSGGSLTTMLGTAGTAVVATGGSTVNLTNYGTVTGSTYLNADPGTFTNYGTYNSGAVVQGNLINSGTVNLGIPGTRPPMTTTVTGDFTQTETGKLVATIDSLNDTNSRLQVDGNASVSGLIVPTAITLLPGTYTVLTAGHLNSSASGQPSLLFNWQTAQSGNTLTISPAANLTPAGVSLTRSEFSLGSYLNRAWQNSDAFFATLFAGLSQIPDAGHYTPLLDAFSGKATEAQSMALAASAGTMLGASLSCPVFVSAGTLLGEDSCVWVRLTGQQTNQWTTNDTLGYKVASASYRLGGQREFLPDWYVGGSLAFGQSWATSDDGSTGYGQSVDGSVSLKHTMGPWTLAGAIALATGTFHSNRLITLPGISASLQSDPSMFLAGGRLRAAYEFAFNDWYVRPYADFDMIYTNLPGFQESGPAGLALDVHDSSNTSLGISPMVEIGGRYDIDSETTLRPFAALGVSFLSNASRAFNASFVGASGIDGTFQSFVKTPSFMANAKLGVQLYRAGHFEVEAEYDVHAGDSFLSQGGGLRLAYHF